MSSVKCSFVAAEVMEVRVAVDAESLGCWVSCLTLLVKGKQSCGGGDMMDEEGVSRRLETVCFRGEWSEWATSYRNENDQPLCWLATVCREKRLGKEGIAGKCRYRREKREPTAIVRSKRVQKATGCKVGGVQG